MDTPARTTSAPSQTPGAAFELAHVTLRYADNNVALDDLTLSIAAGERLCVLGANGSGKSTLASVLCGLLAPDEGSVRLAGYACCTNGAVNSDAYRKARRQLGLVFQNPDDQLITSIVAQELAFGPENLGMQPAHIDEVVTRELARARLAERAQDRPAELSGGQKQRVATAATLTMNPAAVVFDEPGALLDVQGRASVMQVLSELHQQGTTVVHVTHFMEEALAAERVVVLAEGKIVLDGTPEEVFSHPRELAALKLHEPFAARVSDALHKACPQLIPCAAAAELTQQLIPLLQRAALPISTTPQLHAAVDTAPDTVTPASTPATSGSPIVEFDHVSFSYSSQRGAAPAVADVSFKLYPGQNVALIGQTGSGKSTLLRLLCALEEAQAGGICVCGFDAGTRRGRKQIHRSVGYVMQRPERQLFGQSIFEDVAFGPKNQGLSGAELERRVRHALELVGLSVDVERSPFELSGGQRRLCALAGILAMAPRLLVLDEPTAGLDPQSRATLLRILERVRAQGVTTLSVTHNMDDAATSDVVLVLDRSQLKAVGTPQEIFTAARAQELASCGLGLPQALSYSLELQAQLEATNPTAARIVAAHVGEPRSEQALIGRLQELLANSTNGNVLAGERHGH